ncbi:MAG: hypothetical protein JNN15_16940 [Blastocatellia bacterium]|nr:hypothetical protein [Blastocatellia bacterium]
MITGFNTDISHQGTTYHVQTEDKGVSNPMIESLVYVRGAILAAKRTDYSKELKNGLSEEQLQTMLEKQHRTILAVIKAGRIQELVEKLSKKPAEAPQPPPPALSASEPVVEPEPVAPIAPPVQTKQQNLNRTSGSNRATTGGHRAADGSSKDLQPLFAEFDLDKIIFDYLQTDAKEEKIELRIKNISEFYAGENVVLQIEVTKGGIQPLSNQPVIVKVIGTAFKPQIYSGRTGPEGVAVMPITLPTFTAGSAAIVVQASSELGDAEVKHLIRRR